MQENCFTRVIQAWESGEYTLVPNLVPAGSPDRVRARAVLQNSAGVRYVVEAVGHVKELKRKRQAQTLWELATAGCKNLSPWLPPFADAWGIDHDDQFWQVRRYVPGNELPRETYGNDGWRGQAMAQFLAGLSAASRSLTYDHIPFSLSDYIKSLQPRIAERNQALFTDLQPIVAELEPFLHAEQRLPKTFAHGDFHPLNVLWGDQSINSVIDWEFLGPKVFGYDAANLLGCLGMDTPEFLTAPMATAFLHELKASGNAPAEMLQWLPYIIVALRFGWMREWCWRNDKDMIIQELDFMWLILDNRELLQEKFKIA